MKENKIASSRSFPEWVELGGIRLVQRFLSEVPDLGQGLVLARQSLGRGHRVQLLLIPDVDKMPGEEEHGLLNELLLLPLFEQQLASFEKEVWVEHLAALVLCEGEEGVLGPAESSHDGAELQSGLVVVRGKGNHLHKNQL